ncbi:EexN family lipoprotein [Ursidibacter arcticus]
MENKTKSSGLIASIVTCVLAVSGIAACNDKEMTVYDYLVNKPLLDEDMNKCISGEERDQHKCRVVKSAYNKYGFFKDGMYSEEELKKLGKK